MENLVRNVLVLDANHRNIKKVCDFLRSDERLVDLNNIVPTPDDMSPSEAEFWQKNNWDCTNTFDCRQEKYYVLRFSTEWVAPVKAIAKLAKLFPNVEITLWFAHKKYDFIVGMIRFFEGRVIDDIIPIGDTLAEKRIRNFCWESVDEGREHA